MPAMKNHQVPTSDVVEFQQRTSSHRTTLLVGRVAARTNALNQGLHPALKSLGPPKVGRTDSVGAATGAGNWPESTPP
jgi:hypothetical protein